MRFKWAATGFCQSHENENQALGVLAFEYPALESMPNQQLAPHAAEEVGGVYLDRERTVGVTDTGVEIFALSPKASTSRPYL
jgi:hypothetical protein